MSRKPRCSVGFTGSDNFPKGAIWTIHWLPKGYAITRDDRFLCAFPHPETGEWDRCKEMPPFLKAVTDAIEVYFSEHPEEAGVAGKLEEYAKDIRKNEQT